MNERDKVFILADVKDYIQQEGPRVFARDLKREFPEIWERLRDNIDVGKQMALFNE